MNISNQIFKIPDRLLVLVDQAVFSGGNFVVTLFLARLLTPEDFGAFSALVLAGYLFQSLTNALVTQPFQVSVARFPKQKEYLLFTFLLECLLVLVLLLSLGLLSPTLAEHHLLPNRATTPFLLWVGGFLLQDYFRKIFLATARPGWTLYLDASVAVCQILVLLWFSGYPSPDMQSLIFCLGLAYLPSLLVGLSSFRFLKIASRNWKFYWHTHQRQGGWLLFTAVIQWWTNNLFTVASGVFIGMEALGAFRLVQSLFGILNMVFQTFENHLLPEASRLFQSSVQQSKAFLLSSFRKTSLPLALVLVLLFIFSKDVMLLAGGPKYEPYHFIVKGMAVLYACILLGYPVRLAVRMMVLNQTFFIGYVLALGFSLLSYRFLLGHFQLWGAIAGLLFNQIIMLIYWNKSLVHKQFILWK